MRKLVTRILLLVSLSQLNSAQGEEINADDTSTKRTIVPYKSAATEHYDEAVQLQLSGKLKDAVVEYEVALKIDDRLLYARSNLAEIYSLTDKPQAEEQLQRILKDTIDCEDGDCEVRFLALGSLSALKKEQGQTKQSIALLRQALSMKEFESSDDYAKYSNRLRMLEQGTNELPAVDSERIKLKLAPPVKLAQNARKDVRPYDAQAVKHYNTAVDLHVKAKFRDAEKEYEAALERDPRLPEARYNLGVLNLFQNDNKAETYFRQLVADPPNDRTKFESLGRLAEIEMRRGQYNKAATLFRQCFSVKNCDKNILYHEFETEFEKARDREYKVRER